MPINWRETFGDDPETEIPGTKIRYTTRWPSGVHAHGRESAASPNRPNPRESARDFILGRRR